MKFKLIKFQKIAWIEFELKQIVVYFSIECVRFESFVFIEIRMIFFLRWQSIVYFNDVSIKYSNEILNHVTNKIWKTTTWNKNWKLNLKSISDSIKNNIVMQNIEILNKSMSFNYLLHETKWKTNNVNDSKK